MGKSKKGVQKVVKKVVKKWVFALFYLTRFLSVFLRNRPFLPRFEKPVLVKKWSKNGQKGDFW